MWVKSPFYETLSLLVVGPVKTVFYPLLTKTKLSVLQTMYTYILNRRLNVYAMTQTVER